METARGHGGACPKLETRPFYRLSEKGALDIVREVLGGSADQETSDATQSRSGASTRLASLVDRQALEREVGLSREQIAELEESDARTLIDEARSRCRE